MICTVGEVANGLLPYLFTATTRKDIDVRPGRFGTLALLVLPVTERGASLVPSASWGVIVNDVTGAPRGAGGVQRTTALFWLAVAVTLVGASGTPAPAACQWLLTSVAVRVVP